MSGLINADISVRAISESALEAILTLLFEECKDVRVATFPSGDGADYTPRVVAGRVATSPQYRQPTSTVRDSNVRSKSNPGGR